MIKQIFFKITHLTSYLSLFFLAQAIASHTEKGAFSLAAFSPPQISPQCYMGSKKIEEKTSLKDFCKKIPEMISFERDNLILSASDTNRYPVSLTSIRGLLSVTPDQNIISALTYHFGTTSIDILHTVVHLKIDFFIKG